MWVMGTKLRPTARRTSSLNEGAISLSSKVISLSYCNFFHTLYVDHGFSSPILLPDPLQLPTHPIPYLLSLFLKNRQANLKKHKENNNNNKRKTQETHGLSLHN